MRDQSLLRVTAIGFNTDAVDDEGRGKHHTMQKRR